MNLSHWLVIIWVVCSGSLPAQHFTARNLSLEDGLPEYYVSGLVQDKAGFIWAATRDGLARYDGREFKVFRHRHMSQPSLANNAILSIQLVSDSLMLVELENKHLQLFNPITEQFRDLLTDRQIKSSHMILFNPLLAPDKKNLWSRYLTQFARFDSRTGKFKIFPFPLFSIADRYPGNSFIFTNEQRIFAPVPGRLLEFDANTGAYQVWQSSLVGKQGSIKTYYDVPILRRSNSEIIIGSNRQLLFFNPQKKCFHSISIPSPIDTQVGLVYEGVDGQVYFTYGMTVYQLSNENQIIPLWTAPRVDYQNYFQSLLLDRTGVLWIGTNGDGIYQIDQRALPIKTYLYQTNFFHDVWKEQGLVVPAWAKTNAEIYHLRIDGTAPYMTVGFSGWYELLRVDPGGRQFRSLLKLPQLGKLREIDGGSGLRLLPDGTVWMFHPHLGILKADSAGQLLDRFACPTLINWVSSIQPIGQWVWIGSAESGLYAYDLKSRRIVRHLRYQPDQANTLLSDRVLCLAVDPTNPAILWIGTQEGLCRLDTRTMRSQNWSEEQGLPSGTIHTLLTDRQGNLWFSTGKGISRINPRTSQLRHFSTYDGLLDIEYRSNHAMLLPGGRMAFGGATGVTEFDPLSLTDSPYQIPTVLTGLRLSNVLVEPGHVGSPLSRPLNATQTLSLKYTQNFFSIAYAGIQYNKPASLRYRYQLIGVDAHWVNAGSQTLANYTQLEPGDYEFRVQAANADGQWSPFIKTLHIIIDPPWWRAWWAYFLYTLVLSLLVWAYIRYQIDKARLGHEVLLKEQEIRLVKENAGWQTRFFTNVTHEFRTPLSLIISPLEKLLDTPVLPTGIHQHLSVMHRNAQRLLRLINQLLDIAKLEAGLLNVVESRGNLSIFLFELVDSFRLRAERKGVELFYEATDMSTDSLFDSHKLETIGYNLLDNAVKFTPPGGRIQVLLQRAGSLDQPLVQLQVIDSGIGIPSEQQSRIFDRFYQGRQLESSAGGGTGIGLFLITEFTHLLGGKVLVDSQPDQGTTFTVIIPLVNVNDAPLAENANSAMKHAVNNSPDPKTPELSVTEMADVPLILVVEDNDELREFIAGELRTDYRVLVAINGQQGWDLCLAELPDMVISDVMMPLMDGFKLVERIKKTPVTAHIAVVLLTAKTRNDSRMKGLIAGANDYLTKPFQAQELQLRIHNLLRYQSQLRHHWKQRISQLASPEPVAIPQIDDPFLAKFYEVLDRELSNSSFNVDQLADELAVSYRTLHRKLSVLTGTNANELMRTYRLQQAALFLREGYSISETAEKAGFEGMSYFAKLFKAQFGMTPTAFQLAHGQK